jgi:hypothetical protein
VSSKQLWLVCGLVWFAQVYMVFALPEVADEAYYHRWGEYLSWGYFDHPPGVALWSYYGGRLLNIFVLPLAWFGFGVAAKRLGASCVLSELLFVVWCTPLGLASGVLVTPDAPLLLSWSIAILGYAFNMSILIIVGLTMGLWSKAMIIPASIGLLWLCWTDQRFERKRRQKQVFVIVVSTLMLYLPHLWWSKSHNWLPWSFQGGRPWRAFSTLEFIGGQIAVGGGIWTLILLKRYYVCITQKPWRLINDQDWQKVRTWWWLSAPTMLGWFIVSIFTRVEANWTALAWPMGFIWILDTASQQLKRRALGVALVCTLPCLLLPMIHQYIPLSWGPPRDGEALSTCLKHADSLRGHKTPLIVVGRYQEAALLGLPLTDEAIFSVFNQIPVVYLRAHDRRHSQYDFLWSQSSVGEQELPCDTLWIGPKSWVGAHCQAQDMPIIETDKKCQLDLSYCACPY